MLDIACGIPSYNEADNISSVTRQLDSGLSEYFPGKKSAIVNMDSCSEDGTREAFINTPSRSEKIILVKDGVRGKGNMVEMLLEFILENKVRRALLVDADLKSITPDWVYFLLKPLLNGYDYCAPLYSRHKYDGTITNLIAYPLVCGLYGQNIRQPIGGDFSFSDKAAKLWLNGDWRESTRHYGIDNFMTTSAVCAGLKICQVKLGAKIHKASGPKLGRMFAQVVDTLFANAYSRLDFIAEREKLSEPEVFGSLEELPEQVNLNRRDIEKKAAEIIEKHGSFMKIIIPGEVSAGLSGRIGPGDWCAIVYSFLSKFNTADRNSLLEALSGLYFRRILSFMEETEGLENDDAEKKIREDAFLFFEKRDMFIPRPRAGGL